MSRNLCLFLTLILFTDAYYLGNYYVGTLPYRRDAMWKSQSIVEGNIQFNTLTPAKYPPTLNETLAILKMFEQQIGFMDSQLESHLGFGQYRGGRELNLGDNSVPAPSKDKKDLAPMKRFKPCYYSPIQCLIKRR